MDWQRRCMPDSNIPMEFHSRPRLVRCMLLSSISARATARPVPQRQHVRVKLGSRSASHMIHADPPRTCTLRPDIAPAHVERLHREVVAEGIRHNSRTIIADETIDLCLLREPMSKQQIHSLTFFIHPPSVRIGPVATIAVAYLPAPLILDLGRHRLRSGRSASVPAQLSRRALRPPSLAAPPCSPRVRPWPAVRLKRSAFLCCLLQLDEFMVWRANVRYIFRTK